MPANGHFTCFLRCWNCNLTCCHFILENRHRSRLLQEWTRSTQSEWTTIGARGTPNSPVQIDGAHPLARESKFKVISTSRMILITKLRRMSLIENCFCRSDLQTLTSESVWREAVTLHRSMPSDRQLLNHSLLTIKSVSWSGNSVVPSILLIISFLISQMWTRLQRRRSRIFWLSTTGVFWLQIHDAASRRNSVVRVLVLGTKSLTVNFRLCISFQPYGTTF